MKITKKTYKNKMPFFMVKKIWLVLAEMPESRGMLAEKPVSRGSSGMWPRAGEARGGTRQHDAQRSRHIR